MKSHSLIKFQEYNPLANSLRGKKLLVSDARRIKLLKTNQKSRSQMMLEINSSIDKI